MMAYSGAGYTYFIALAMVLHGDTNFGVSLGILGVFYHLMGAYYENIFRKS
jgi:hypothetical protein